MASGAGLIQFPFGGGLDQGTRDEHVDAGVGWSTLENVRQDKRGALSKRYGFSELNDNLTSGSSDHSRGYRMFGDGDTLVRVVNHTSGYKEAHVYDPTSSRWAVLRGKLSDCITTLRDAPICGSPAASTASDLAYTNGYVCITYLASLVDVYAVVMHAATGAIVSPVVKVGSVSAAADGRLAVVGNAFVLVRADTANADLKAWYLDTTSGATISTGWVAMSDLAADLGSPFRFSVCSLTGASARGAVVYQNTSAGTDRITVVTFTTAGVVETQTVNTSSTTTDHVDIAGGVATSTLWVSWNEATAVKVIGLTGTSLATTVYTAATVITATTGVNLIGIVNASSTTGRAIVNSDTTPIQSEIRGWSTAAGAVSASGSQVTVYNAAPCARPFLYSGRYYVPVYWDEYAQNTVTLVDWSGTETFFRPVACWAPGLADLSLTGKRQTWAGATSTTLYTVTGTQRSGVAYGVGVVKYDFGSTNAFQAARFGNSLYLSGGLLQYSDGSRVAEAGFLYRPPTPTTATSGTGITAATGWRYVAVYEEVDADGNWHQSGISTPSASTGAVANKTVVVTVQPLTVSSRLDSQASSATSVRIAIYRTSDGGEAPYYRVDTIANSTSAATLTYNDTTADTTLTANAKLYSQYGVIGTAQDHRPPPGLAHLVEYNGMLVGAIGSDLWYSGQLVTGEGAWFNPIFQMPVPEDITALAVQDGTLFAFTRRRVYALNGEPPSDNGASGGMGAPRRLAVDVGCIEQRSVCVTALGIFFQSERGIEILTRSQSVEWIGESVQDTVASFPYVMAATVDPASSCVLIECAGSVSGGQAQVASYGRTLVYDLSLRVWASTDRRTNTWSQSDVPAQSAAVIYTGSAYRYAWLGGTGNVYVEDRTTHLDPDSTWVTMRAVSPWIKASGLQGLQHVNRALLLAKNATHHDLNVYFAYDYSSTYKSARLYTATQLATLNAALPNQQIEHPLHDDARCEAIRIKIEDATPSTGQSVTTGQGATWIGLTFEVAPQQGAYKLPDESR